MESPGTLVEAGRSERVGDLHVHATTEIKGATVLPNWFVAVLILSLSLTLAAGGATIGVLLWRLNHLETELWLLKNYTEGRIDHLPYKPSTLEIKRSDEDATLPERRGVP